MALTSIMTPPAILIIAIALAYAIGSIALQRRISNAKKMRELQRKISESSKRMNAMIKAGASKEEIASKQKEMMPLMSESMKNSIKPMIVILPLFVLLYYLILPFVINLTGQADNTINFILSGLSYQNFFFAVVFIFGIATSIAILAYDKKKGKEEAKLDVKEALSDAAAPKSNA